MKFVSMDKIYELSDEVGSAYVDVCLIDNELATERVIPIEVLEEIRQEIEERINNCGDGTFKDGLCEALDIVYFKIKELSE